jgi:hypothetical protein
MAGVEAPLMVAWELTGEGKEKGKERRGMGARTRGTAGAAPMEGGARPMRCCVQRGVRAWLCVALFLHESLFSEACCSREGESSRRGRRREENKRKKKKRKEKKKKKI